MNSAFLSPRCTLLRSRIEVHPTGRCHATHERRRTLNTIEYQLILKNTQGIGHRVPPDSLAPLFLQVKPVIRNTILMAFEGRSTKRGQRPGWLDAAADIRFVAISGDGDTVLHFEAPRLGEAAGVLYRQQQRWPPKPTAQGTGFDLLGRVLSDVRAGDEDSPRFDPPLLTRLARLGSALDGTFREIDLIGHHYTASDPAVLDTGVRDNARRLYEETPPPQRARVAGRLSMIEVSTQTFVLELDTGERVRGVLQDGSVADAKILIDQRVLVLGMAVYRPSGRVLRIDAERIKAGTGESRFWSTIPDSRKRSFDVREVRQPQTRTTGASAIFGQWPGDETEEEILEALEKLS